MARTLDVYLLNQLVGTLIQDDHGQMLFSYLEKWLDSDHAVAISNSLPLRAEQFSRNECRGFFGGILPEASQRDLVAKNLGISAKNDFAMLEQIGGECAGAISLLPHGELYPTLDIRYRQLSSSEVAETLRNLPLQPLLAGNDGIRLSLAGAQTKLAVFVSGEEISIPMGGAPSTHILKPAIREYADVVINEAFCMNLAASLGLPVAPVRNCKIEEISFLLVERYDRISDSGRTTRLHQEDFCQALGIASDNKYQSEGGPSLKQSFDLIRRVSTAPVLDLQTLLSATIFNFLIGNNDAHGKNFSFLYTGQSRRMAPLYDLICTSYYPTLSKRMAMKIGGEYDSTRILPGHFDTLAEEAGLAKPMVRRRISQLAQMMLARLAGKTPENATEISLHTLIESRCRSTITKFKG